MTELFDFDKALKAIQSGQAISGQGPVCQPDPIHSLFGIT